MTTLSITHPQLVAALVKPAGDIADTLTLHNIDLWHGATGVSGEAGEILEALMFPPESGVDRVNLREELGDMFFYIEQLVQRSGVKVDFSMATDLAATRMTQPVQEMLLGVEIAIHAAQVLDSVKKAAIYNKALDTEMLTNQLNSLAVPLLTLGWCYGLEHEECLKGNIAKLSKRYASLSYSDKAAQDRADKVQPPEGIIPERKPFRGEDDTRAHTPGVTNDLK